MAVAFSRGNVFPVAKDLHHRFPGVALVIAGDDDRYTPGNPGRRDAEGRPRGGWRARRSSRISPAWKPPASRPISTMSTSWGGLAHLKRQLETPRGRPAWPRSHAGTAHLSDRSRTAVRGARC